MIPVYTPLLATYQISPSRLLSVMDPLLSLGFLWRCVATYCGIDNDAETKKYKMLLGLHSNEEEKNSNTGFSSLKHLADSFMPKPFVSKNESGEFSTNLLCKEFSVNNEINSLTINDSITQEKNDQLCLSEQEKHRLLRLHKILGDSVFLLEALRKHPFTTNKYMSPLLTDDKVLAKFPKTYLIVIFIII